MAVQEQVLIVLKAKDEVSQVVEGLRRTIEDLGKSFNNSIPTSANFAQPFEDSFESVGESVEKTNYRLSGFGVATQNVGSQANITFTQMAERMDNFHVGLNRVTNAMTGLFGTMGLAGMAHESWMYSTQRQTNQIYLSMRRGTDEARSMYNEIQNIVMELPGDDTFLTTILTQASGRDMTMSIDNVRQLGDAIADYYVGATAKGQLSYETQRELTSYILTGETRMFTNSILADEIELLKNKNTVTERATALQEALNKTGYDNMAHYESATNAMEEFRGHFQKAFADLGSLVLPVIQTLLKLYNALDTLFLNGGISAGIISVATGIALLTTALGTIGFVTPMVNEGVKSVVLFGKGISNIRTRINEANSVINVFRSHISSLVTEAQELVAIPNDIQNITSATQIRSVSLDPSRMSTVGYELENGAILSNTEIKLQNLYATTRLTEQELALKMTQSGLTYEAYLNTVGLDANTMALLENMAQRMGKSEAELLDLAITSELSTSEFLETLELNLNTIETDLNTVSKGLNAEATLIDIDATNIGIYATIRSNVVNAYSTVVNFAKAVSEYAKGDATLWNETVENSAILTDLKSIYTKIASTVTNFAKAVSEFISADATAQKDIIENISILTELRSIVTTIGEISVKSIKVIVTWLTTEATFGDAVAKVFDTDATVGLTLAEVGLLDVTVLLEGALAPIVAVILAIIGVGLLLITVIEEIGKAFGWWTDFGSMFDAIWSGINRIWEAFMNSEPVQEIITTFQNFFYTIETFFGSIMGILGGIWELFFGVNDEANGTFDIVQTIIDVFGTLLNIVYQLSPIKYLIEGILAVFDAIGSTIGWIMDTWNTFVDSPEMQGLIMEFQEIREAFGETWEVIGEAIDELMSAFGSLFQFMEEDDTTGEVVDNGNWLLDLLRGIATVISTVVVPVIRTFAEVLKVVAIPIRFLAGIIQGISNLIYGTSDSVEEASESTENMGESVSRTISPISSLFDWISSIISPITNFIESIDWLRIILYGLLYALSPVLGISVILLDLANQFGVFEWIGGLIDNLTNGVDWLKIAFDGLMFALSPVILVLQTILSLFNQLRNIGGIISGVVGYIGQAFNGLISFLEPVVGFINSIVEKFQWVEEKIGWVGDAVGGTVNGVVEFLQGDTEKVPPQTLGQGDPNFLGLSAEEYANISATISEGLRVSNDAYLNRPMNYDRSSNLTSQYQYNQQQKSQTIINNFNEGSVQADARNMSAKDVQKMFTGAFGYNKARGTKGILN